MRKAERLVIYAGLLAALGMGLGFGGFHQPATASSASLSADTPKIAIVDVLAITERLLLSDRYRPAREAYAQDQTKSIEPIVNAMRDMEARAQTLGQDKPAELQALFQQYQQKQAELETARNAAQANMDTFNTRQLEEAYRLVIETADRLGSAAGYTHILASRSGPITLRSTNISGAVQELLARPMLKMPAADDLTERMIAELNLTNVQVPSAAPDPNAGPALPTPAPAPAGTP